MTITKSDTLKFTKVLVRNNNTLSTILIFIILGFELAGHTTKFQFQPLNRAGPPSESPLSDYSSFLCSFGSEKKRQECPKIEANMTPTGMLVLQYLQQPTALALCSLLLIIHSLPLTIALK